MGMFITRPMTKALTIARDKQWYPNNFSRVTLKDEMVFDKGEMVVDPTGIGSHYAVIPDDKTIGGYYAKKGCYGFARGGLVYIIHHSWVLYG
jgi:hypothetical protein